MHLTELLRQLNIPYRETGGHLNVRSGWLGIECPYCTHGASGGFKLGLNIAHRYFNCWTCGPLPQVKTLARLSGLSPGRCYELLGGLDPLPEDLFASPVRGKLELPSGCGPLQPCHRIYLRDRGLDPEEMVRLWRLQGVGAMAGAYSFRIVVPVVWRGETVSWTSRSIGGDNPIRYLAAKPGQEKVRAKSLLMGEDYCRHSIIITEGPFDCMRLGPGTVATMGVSYTAAQVLRASWYMKRIVCFDSEPAAQERAKRLCRELAVFPGETLRVELDAKDPGSAGDKEVKRLRKMLV